MSEQTRVSANCSCEHAQFSYDFSRLQCNCARAVLESPCMVSPPVDVVYSYSGGGGLFLYILMFQSTVQCNG